MMYHVLISVVIVIFLAWLVIKDCCKCGCLVWAWRSVVETQTGHDWSRYCLKCHEDRQLTIGQQRDTGR